MLQYDRGQGPGSKRPFDMSEGTLEILECVAVSIFVFVLNWRMRVRLKYDLTSAADFVLAIVAFDFTAMLGSPGFSQAVRSTWFRDHFLPVSGFLFVASFIAWSVGSLRLEQALDAHYGVEGERNFYFAVSWVLVAILLGTHIYWFLGG